MTALAGYWAFAGGEEPLGACGRILEAQSPYGRQAFPNHADGPIAIGKALYPTLPEDRFDTGPVVGGGGRWVLAADVRLDDRGGLAAALGIGADRAAGLSDSALVMAAIERWEDDAIRRLHGDFAIALWDKDRRRLLLARDLCGQRPLHYHRSGRHFAFASMPAGLRALTGVGGGPDEEALASFLAVRPPDGHRSFFAGIERVLPGELHVVSEGESRIGRHWTLPVSPLRLKRDSDYAEAVREALERSVGARLRGAGGRVATHLSGGLDSSGVTATAARLIGAEGRISAFTAVPEATGFERKGRFADESAHAAAVAALYPNIEHVPVRTAGRSPIAGLDRNFALYQAPVLNLCNFVWGEAIAEAAKARGHKVLLTGQMGNFTFSHPGLELLPQLLAKGRWLTLARTGIALHRRGTAIESVAAQILRPFIPSPVWGLINRMRGLRLALSDHSALHPDLAARMPAARAAGIWRTREMRAAMVQASEYGNFRQGALAGWGLDVRDPTSDRRLIELCLSIPAAQFVAGGVPRSLARRALTDRLPAAVVGETKKGFQGADWHLGVLAAWDPIRDELGRIITVPAARRLLDMDRLESLVNGSRERDWNSYEAQAHYRLALLRGLSAGHFLRRAAAGG